MHAPRNARTRAGLLIIALSLIGGTGCITMAVVESAKQASAQRAAQEQHKATVESYRSAAAQGDVAGMTQLGLEYLAQTTAVGRDVARGMALLEQAVARQYGPAEYALGLILLNHARTSPGNPPVPTDPTRGMALIKRAASRACEYRMVSSVVDLSDPASTIQYLYRSNTSAYRDLAQANLWFSRDIVHCQKGNAYSVRNVILPNTQVTAQDQTETLAWLQLLPAAALGKDDVAKGLTLADPAAAQRRAAQLRQAVADSERDYPAPSQKQFVVKIGQAS